MAFFGLFGMTSGGESNGNGNGDRGGPFIRRGRYDRLLHDYEALVAKKEDLEAILDSYHVAVPILAERVRAAGIHAGRLRIGCLPRVDPARITARLRAIEPSIRVENGENQWLIYADRALKEEEIRAVESELSLSVDRT